MALHGRELDLERIEDTLAALQTGRGRALFLTGEPGIGKSTLLAEARTRARGLVLSGAAWESGGAPPYWPWLQILRDAAAQAGERVRELPGADRIASLVEGWGAASTTASPEPAAARFALLDAVVRALLALAADKPLLILLDDLHAADLPTLDLLVMLVRELPRAPIALVAAWREAELAVNTEAGQRLARACRFGDVQALRRLTADEVASWVGKDAQAIFASTEGNPLFVEETLRSRGGAVGVGVANVIADHLALASEPTREVLAVASVLGREIDAALVGVLVKGADDAVATALREATNLGIVEKIERGWRFRHVLLRDHLYEGLTPTKRKELHRAIGDELGPRDAVRAAHHLLAGQSPHAVEAARAAATRASTVYAFEDALALLEAAQRALPTDDDDTAIDVRLELADARHQLGMTELARLDCMKAAELCRARNDAQRFAQAALVYARELMSGARDPTMIGLLDEANTKLALADSAIRARVLARLASALVPGPQGEVDRAQIIAREAVAMARRLGDAETTMFALRYAVLAHSYQITLDEGYKMAVEVVAISDQLHRPLEAIDHRAWLIGANLARGNFEAAQAALTSFEALVAQLPQPHYRWRAPALRAAWATRAGDFVSAERYLAIARDLAREYQLDRGTWAARFGQLAIVAATRDPVRAAAFEDEFRSKIANRLGAGGGNMLAYMSAITGKHDQARAELERTIFFPALIVLQFGAEAMVMVGAREHVARLLPMFEVQNARHPLIHGPQGSVFVEPSSNTLGRMYALLDRPDDAVRKLEEGLALSTAIHAAPAVASASQSLAQVLEKRGKGGDRERAANLAADASRIANLYGIHGIAAVPAAVRVDTPAAAPIREAQQLAIACADGRARVRWNSRTIETSSAKGLEFLAALVSAPGREIHVSDLIGDDDRGDAGEMLDAKARTAYKARAEELQEELEEARARNDLGRAEGLASELESITDELLAATGLGGRARKAGSRVERARVNVQRRIKDAIKRLGAEDESLGRYLDATIRTGTFCSFVPLDT